MDHYFFEKGVGNFQKRIPPWQKLLNKIIQREPWGKILSKCFLLSLFWFLMLKKILSQVIVQQYCPAKSCTTWTCEKHFMPQKNCPLISTELSEVYYRHWSFDPITDLLLPSKIEDYSYSVIPMVNHCFRKQKQKSLDVVLQ